MNKPLQDSIEAYITAHESELVPLISKVASIVSPTGHTTNKANWVLSQLHEMGAAEAYIDDVGNILYPCQVKDGVKCPLYNAHIDTVFNQVDTITPKIDGNILAAPSCGDNSSSVAGLLFIIRMIFALHITLPKGILFAFNVGEEGLGNLQGMKAIMEVWKDKVSEVVAADCTYDEFVNVAVGSKRYNVAIDAEGGHSWMHFGNENAIAIASSIITKLYGVTVPKDPKTTYNIGTITGGTTVNSIAAHVEFTVDLRSESKDELDGIDAKFLALLDEAKSPKRKITTTVIGQRPCSNGLAHNELCDRIKAIRDAHNLPTTFVSASTDANIPFSLGIPAISFGFCRSQGEHTVHETLEIDTLAYGMRQMVEFMFHDVQ